MSAARARILALPKTAASVVAVCSGMVASSCSWVSSPFAPRKATIYVGSRAEALAPLLAGLPFLGRLLANPGATQRQALQRRHRQQVRAKPRVGDFRVGQVEVLQRG